MLITSEAFFWIWIILIVFIYPMIYIESNLINKVESYLGEDEVQLGNAILQVLLAVAGGLFALSNEEAGVTNANYSDILIIYAAIKASFYVFLLTAPRKES